MRRIYVNGKWRHGRITPPDTIDYELENQSLKLMVYLPEVMGKLLEVPRYEN